MTHRNKELGFSAIELMITLFIAVSFFTAGYQIYSLITSDGFETRSRALANNTAYDYLQRYKPDSTASCTPSAPLSNQAITVATLTNVTISISITCSQINDINVAKETVTIKYGTPSKSITSTTVVNTKPISCPTGFIVVPGSSLYGTSNFCVMKYEAKNAGGNVAASTASGVPWAGIVQTNAVASYSKTVVGCTGCHLITEAEWLTIAQNVASVASNWSSGTVGSGYIFSGHNDNSAVALAADSNDNNNYSGTGNSAGDATTTNGMVGNSQRRTLTLTNGEVIWDFAGNVSEWVDSYVRDGQPGISGEAAYAWKQWTAVTFAGSLPINPSPAFSGLPGASTWTSANGIGQLWSYAGTTASNVFCNGGSYSSTIYAGIYGTNMSYDASGMAADIGFRVAR
jgi:Tfp pilus assembly protein PilV